MFGIERLQAIRELLKEKKSVEVTYLSQALEVSEVTIRRDLDKLEKEGFIAKTYGGAILIEDGSSLGEKKGEKDKWLLDKGDEQFGEVVVTAAKLIENGDTIFIAGSPMGRNLAGCIGHKEDLNVVTNNIEIAMYLYKETTHKVIMIGGEVDVQTGNVHEFEQLEELLIEKAFIAVNGVDDKFGYTVNDKSDVRLYKALKDCTRTMVLVTITDNYNKRGLVKLAPLEAIEDIVCDKNMPDTFKSYYYEHNIKVHTNILRKG